MTHARSATSAPAGTDLPASRLQTSWGDAWIAGDGRFVTRVVPPGPARIGGAHDERGLAGHPVVDLDEASPLVRDLADRLRAWLDGEAVELASAEQVESWLAAAGVHGFQLRALVELARVPRGVAITYGELATLAGAPGAARAAGTACARNPLPIVVPCHRVLPAGRRLGRYGAGSGPDTKRRLLELEGLAVDGRERVVARR